MRLGASHGHPEAGHHFIEDQDTLVTVADLAQCLEKPRLGRNAVHVAGHRLDDDAGNLIPHLLEAGFHGIGIVVGQRDGVFRQGSRHARGTRLAMGEGAGSALTSRESV